MASSRLTPGLKSPAQTGTSWSLAIEDDKADPFLLALSTATRLDAVQIIPAVGVESIGDQRDCP
jgi:hypothetical protein